MPFYQGKKQRMFLFTQRCGEKLGATQESTSRTWCYKWRSPKAMPMLRKELVFFWNVLNVWKSSHLNTLLKQFLCSKWKRSSWSVARRLSCWMVSNFIIADVAMKRLPMNICMYLPLIKSCHVYGLLTSIYLQAVDLFCMWYESYRTVASTVLEFRECRGILPKW